jgi:hypothetical protein
MFQVLGDEVKTLPEQEINNLNMLKEQVHGNLFDFYPPFDATDLK